MRRQDRRFLIVAFDALRPDMVHPELMPNLHAFAGAGCRFTQSRATFPTETRVNQTAMVTGCYPSRHGIVGNRFLDPVAAPDRLFNTGDESQLSEGDRRLGGKLVGIPVLGELLADQGRRLAVISAGTPGGTRMLHHKAEHLGGFRLALHRPDATVPTQGLDRLVERLGPIPELEKPANSWITYVTDAYLKFVEPELAPDVTILWFCEPDSSYHYLGIGSAPNLAAIRHADAEFGRIMAAREASEAGRRLQVVTLSDHGQLTVTGSALNIAGALTGAGFKVAETLGDGADVAVALDRAGGFYVRDSEPGLIAALVDWLKARSWCGPIFTREGHGCLRHEQVGIDHPRAPDIGLVLESDDGVNKHGLPGRSRHDSDYPEGGGIHGGLHALELHNWLALEGDAFRQGFRSDLHAGLIDILPTFLTLLGEEVPDWIQGRVLAEACLGQAATATAEPASLSGEDGTRLTVTRVGDTRYLDQAWVKGRPERLA